MSLSLLVVDDDDAFRERLALSFRRRGYQVQTAANAAQAIALLDDGDFHGAVIDLKLPGENGLAIVRHLRNVAPEARVIILTGYGSIATAIDAIRLGASDYLAKPADTDQILSALFPTAAPPSSLPEEEEPPVPSLERVEWEHLQRVLHECEGNISKTARRLGIERRSLQRRLQKLPPSR